MSFATLILQVLVAWILMASAAYYGAMQALCVYFDGSSTGSNHDTESGGR